MSQFGSPSHCFCLFGDEPFAWNRMWSNSLHNVDRIRSPNERSTDSEDYNDSVFNISESETESQKKKRMNIKKNRNIKLNFEEKVDLMGVLGIETPITNEKTLETLWKLYHDVGETIEDIKKKLIGSPTSVKINKVEDVHCVNIESEEYTADEESRSIKSKDLWEYFDLENACDPSDILDIEIHELDKTIQLLNECDVETIAEPIAWTYKTTVEHLRNSESFESSPNCTYDVPRLKKITNAELVTDERDTRKRRIKSTNVNVQVKKRRISSNAGENEPIICNMYGVTTFNYNDYEPPKMIIPDCFKISKLSDTSSDNEAELTFPDGGKTKKMAVEHTNLGISNSRFINRYKRKRTKRDYSRSSYSLLLSSESDESAKVEELNMPKSSPNVIDGSRNTTKRIEHFEADDSISTDTSTSSTTDSSTDVSTCNRSSCSCSSSTSFEQEDY